MALERWRTGSKMEKRRSKSTHPTKPAGRSTVHVRYAHIRRLRDTRALEAQTTQRTLPASNLVSGAGQILRLFRGIHLTIWQVLPSQAAFPTDSALCCSVF